MQGLALLMKAQQQVLLRNYSWSFDIIAPNLIDKLESAAADKAFVSQYCHFLKLPIAADGQINTKSDAGCLNALRSEVGAEDKVEVYATMATLQGTFAFLPPPAECLAILVGCLEVGVFGLTGLANPVEFAEGYGIPIKGSSTVQKHPGALAPSSDEESLSSKELESTQVGLHGAIAVRNLQHGALILAFALYFKDRRALGLTVGFGLLTTVGDYFLVRAHGLKEAEFGHIIGIVNCSLLGLSLLWWDRTDPWW